MKKTILNRLNKFFLVALFSCMQLMLLAQETNPEKTTSSTTTKTTTTETWYVQPWVWVVAGAIFVIILIALLSGRSSSNTETRTTVIKDNR